MYTSNTMQTIWKELIEKVLNEEKLWKMMYLRVLAAA